jgi:hypothetical protein
MKAVTYYVTAFLLPLYFAMLYLLDITLAAELN